LSKIETLSKQFKLQMEAAKKAEIYEHTFIAFGSLLGYVRERGFIGHDNDMDVGILVDKITTEQIDVYIKEMSKPLEHSPKGLLSYRGLFEINRHTGKHFWISLRMSPKSTCYKCCNWFMFEHKGYMYHHKGGSSKVKGLPARYINKIGHEVEYLGTKVHIPRYAGACLDFWYPDWDTKRTGVTKSEGIELKVKSWAEPSKWEFVK